LARKRADNVSNYKEPIMRRQVVLMMGLLLLGLPGVTTATTTIEAGTHFWQPGVFVIPIIANGNDPLQGVNLSLIMGSGGLALGNVADAPIITAIDFTAPGLIFAANNTGDPLPEN
jgi:hypothetical protein